MQNTLKYYLYNALWTAVNTLTAGTVLQTFLMENGFSEEITNIFTSASQIITLVIMLLFSSIVDRLRNVIRASANTYLLYIPLIVVLVGICFMGSIPVMLAVLLSIGMAAYSAASGLHSSLLYKLPYVVLDMSHYGRITSICGILTGVFGLLLSMALTGLQDLLGYKNAMTVIFILCIPLTLAALFMIHSMKPIAQAPVTMPQNTQTIHYFKFKPFSQLILANLFRGLGTGILNVAATIGYFLGCLDSTGAAIMVVISNLTTFLGSGLYAVTTGRLPEKLIILLSSICIFLTAPVMIIGNNTIVFLLFYGFATLFWTVINYSIPVAVVQIADYSVMGQYSSGRLLLHTLGSSLAGFVCIPMIRLLGALPTMLLTGAMFLICGISYYWYMKKNNLR